MTALGYLVFAKRPNPKRRCEWCQRSQHISCRAPYGKTCCCGHDEAAHYRGVVPCQGDQGHCECPRFDPDPVPDDLFDPEPWK